MELLRKRIRQLEQALFKTQRQRDTAQDKVTQQRRQIYDLETALVEEKGKNLMGKMFLYLCALPRMDRQCILPAEKRGTKG